MSVAFLNTFYFFVSCIVKIQFCVWMSGTRSGAKMSQFYSRIAPMTVYIFYIEQEAERAP